MRPCLFAVAFAALLAAPAAFAGDTHGCKIELEEGDVLVERKDLVLKDGQHVHDAIAMHGNVVVKKGAEVHSVVAFKGGVTVEAGAVVKGDVMSLGGELQLQDGARVEGNAISIGGKVKRADSASVSGDQFSLGSLEVNGTDLVGSLVGKIMSEMTHCRVTLEGAEAKAK